MLYRILRFRKHECIQVQHLTLEHWVFKKMIILYIFI
jgi:hypothetical protein